MQNTTNRPRRQLQPGPSATPDTVRRQLALSASISRRLDLCSLDEVRVVDYVLGRLELGRERYGLLNLSRDTRDWSEEERQEHADAVVYRACAELMRLDRVHADLRDAAAIELVENGLAELRDVQLQADADNHRSDCCCYPCVQQRMGFDLGGEGG